ncbi:MAG: hypothetical protein IJV33_02310 [Bacteroidaceae bacterium]|nr:hypothetical protein [Bacteroidaceae bacterium]
MIIVEWMTRTAKLYTPMMAAGRFLGLLLLMACVFAGCSRTECGKSADLSDNVRSFWGDSAVVLQVSQPQSGYQVSFIHNKDLIIAHFERGDSISRYCALWWLPDTLKSYEHAEPGVYTVDLDIPVIKVDTLGGSKIPKSDVFFMDVNFDGHEEFMQSYLGNGWIGYYCYDLVQGWSDACPGLIGAMQEEPYCSFSSGINSGYDNYVTFDYDKKEIYVLTTSGCCAHTDTWAKYFEGDSLGNRPCVKVVKQEHHSFESGIETIETYTLQNDTLKLVGITKRKY